MLPSMPNAIGTQLPIYGAGGSGPGSAIPPILGPDHQAPRYIVGNELAGDTINVCDYLDPGDGTGIAAALLAAQTAGVPLTDVFVRSGTYTLTGTLDVWGSTRLWGAGRGQTILVGDTAHRRVIAVNWTDVGYPTTLDDFTIRMPVPVEYADGTEVLSLVETTCNNVHVVFEEGRGEPVAEPTLTAVFRWTGGFEGTTNVTGCSVVNAPSNTAFDLPTAIACFDTEGSNTTGLPQTFIGCATTAGDVGFQSASGTVAFTACTSQAAALLGIDARTTVGSTMTGCTASLSIRGATLPIAAFRWSGDYAYDCSTNNCNAYVGVDEESIGAMVAFSATAGQNNVALGNTGNGFSVGIDIGTGFDSTRVGWNGLRNGTTMVVNTGTNTEDAHNVLS